MREITKYNSYRVFLKDFIQHKKAEDSRFSSSQFAKAAGLSPSGLAMILEGQRNLTAKHGGPKKDQRSQYQQRNRKRMMPQNRWRDTEKSKHPIGLQSNGNYATGFRLRRGGV